MTKKKLRPGPSKLDKFSKSAFECLFHTIAFTYFLIYLSNKTWLCNVEECWKNYPYHPISQSLVEYYMLQLAHYGDALVTHVVSNNRKRNVNYWMMLVHHLIADFVILTFTHFRGVRKCIGTWVFDSSHLRYHRHFVWVVQVSTLCKKDDDV